MATITGYGSKHSHEFKLTVNETSTSVANNTSEVSFSFTIYKASYSWSQWNSITYTITINGTSYTGTIPSYSAGSTMTIRTGTQTIAHNSDGTKSISYSFSVSDGSGQSYTCGNASASGTMSLTTIARYANLTKLEVKSKTVNSITLSYTTDKSAWLFVNLNNGEGWLNGGEPFKSNTTSGELTIYYKDIASTKRLDPNTSYKISVLCRALNRDSEIDTQKDIQVSTYDIAKISSAPNINIGNSHTVTWSNPSGASTSLKLCKTDGTSIINYGTVTGTSKNITPTASTMYALTPNSNTITLRYIITTTANSTSYTNYKDCVFTVTNSNPTFSNFTYQDTNATTVALTGNNQIIVKRYSNIKGIISTTNKATAKNSATMSTYKMVIGNKTSQFNYNSSEEVSTTINNANSNVVDMYAIDSRGNSTKVSKTAIYKEYSELTIQSVTVTRSSNGVGKEVTLKFNGTIWNNSFGEIDNKIKTCKYQYKPTSSNDWKDGNTELTYTISDNKFSGNLAIKGDLEAEGFSVENSFNVRLVVSDELITKTYDVILGSGTPAIAVYKDNVAIGQKYDTSEGSKLQVNGATRIKGNTNIEGETKTQKINVYFTGTKNSACWIYIGDFVFSSQGSYAVIDCYTGSGQNGNAGQNTHAKILLKQGWTGNSLPIGVTTNFTQNYSSSYKVKIAHTSLSSCKLYIYLPFSYNDLTCIVNGSYKTFTSAMTTSTTAPTTDKESAYYWTAAEGIFNRTTRGDLSWVSGEEAETVLINKRALANWSGAYQGTDSNLLYCNQGAIQAKPTSLFDNASGTTGTVTLSETAANFSYLEIFYTKATMYNSVKVYSPNGKIANINLFYQVTSAIVQHIFAQIKISGTSITKSGTGSINYNSSGISGISFDDNSIKIYKVIGYR